MVFCCTSAGAGGKISTYECRQSLLATVLTFMWPVNAQTVAGVVVNTPWHYFLVGPPRLKTLHERAVLTIVEAFSGDGAHSFSPSCQWPTVLCVCSDDWRRHSWRSVRTAQCWQWTYPQCKRCPAAVCTPIQHANHRQRHWFRLPRANAHQPVKSRTWITYATYTIHVTKFAYCHCSKSVR